VLLISPIHQGTSSWLEDGSLGSLAIGALDLLRFAHQGEGEGCQAIEYGKDPQGQGVAFRHVIPPSGKYRSHENSRGADEKPNSSQATVGLTAKVVAEGSQVDGAIGFRYSEKEDKQKESPYGTPGGCHQQKGHSS